MVHLLMAAVALVVMVVGFNRVYCIHGINQAYLGLYKGLFDKAVVVSSSSGAYMAKPKFYFAKVKSLLEEYYETNLTPYCRSYTYTILGKGAGGTYTSFIAYADSIHTTFTVKINDMETRTKEAVFSIERSDLYE